MQALANSFQEKKKAGLVKGHGSGFGGSGFGFDKSEEASDGCSRGGGCGRGKVVGGGRLWEGGRRRGGKGAQWEGAEKVWLLHMNQGIRSSCRLPHTGQGQAGAQGHGHGVWAARSSRAGKSVLSYSTPLAHHFPALLQDKAKQARQAMAKDCQAGQPYLS